MYYDPKVTGVNDGHFSQITCPQTTNSYKAKKKGNRKDHQHKYKKYSHSTDILKCVSDKKMTH